MTELSEEPPVPRQVQGHQWDCTLGGLGSTLYWCTICNESFAVMPDGPGSVAWRESDGRQAVEMPQGRCKGPGTGNDRVDPVMTSSRLCKRCEGRGEISLGPDPRGEAVVLHCLSCGGKGVQINARWCNACGGNGVGFDHPNDTEIDCKVCKGKGWWTGEDIADYHRGAPEVCKQSCGNQHSNPFTGEREDLSKRP